MSIALHPYKKRFDRASIVAHTEPTSAVRRFLVSRSRID
jgi:hypothetical protein